MRIPKIYNEITKAWHDKKIMRKNFQLGATSTQVSGKT